MFFKNSPNVLFRHKNVLFDKLLGKKKTFLCLQKCFPMETWWPKCYKNVLVNESLGKNIFVSSKMFSYGNLVARESQWGVERDWASRQSLSYFYRDRSMTSKSYLRHISINLVQLKIWKVIFSLVQAHQSSSHFYRDYHGRIWYKRANTAWHILISWRKGDVF